MIALAWPVVAVVAIGAAVFLVLRLAVSSHSETELRSLLGNAIHRVTQLEARADPSKDIDELKARVGKLEMGRLGARTG